MASTQTARTEFAQALKAVATERGLELSVILDTIKEAIVAAYKRDARERGEETEGFDFDVEMDPISGGAKVFSWPTGEEAKRADITPPGFGRIAAQTAKQVIHQKIREAEKGVIIDEFSGRVGSLISGIVLRFDGADVRVDIGRTEAIMPAEERIPTERLSLSQRNTFLLKAIEETPRGKELILSRADPQFVVKLFAREVPELASGAIDIKVIAREAGIRTKIAVATSQNGIDPVGSCVGQKGVRVQAVTNELGGERVDIIPWTTDVEELIKSALAPATVLAIAYDAKTMVARVTVAQSDLSVAIGKDGQNVRLASQLTGCKIDVEGAPEESKSESDSTPVAAEPEAVPTNDNENG